jgi:hypothetical protein
MGHKPTSAAQAMRAGWRLKAATTALVGLLTFGEAVLPERHSGMFSGSSRALARQSTNGEPLELSPDHTQRC